MLSTLYCEFLKLRRTFFYSGLILFIIINAFITYMPEESFKTSQWGEYLVTVEAANFFFIYVFIFTFVSAYVFSKDFSDNMASTIYSYSVGRTKIFISKFIFITIVIAAVYRLNFSTNIIKGLIKLTPPLTYEMLLIHLKVSLYSAMFQIALAPITIFITLLSRNIIAPFIYSAVVFGINIGGFFLGRGKYIYSNPFMLPSIPVFNILTKANSVDANTVLVHPQSIRLGLITFIIGIVACLLYCKKADIY